MQIENLKINKEEIYNGTRAYIDRLADVQKQNLLLRTSSERARLVILRIENKVNETVANDESLTNADKRKTKKNSLLADNTEYQSATNLISANTNAAQLNDIELDKLRNLIRLNTAFINQS